MPSTGNRRRGFSRRRRRQRLNFSPYGGSARRSRPNWGRSMSVPPERDYRWSLNLAKTEFPMRAELPKREPARVQWWAERHTYLRRLEQNRQRGGTPFVLHDGSPYANGDLHMGTFLNRTLKDALVKIH